MKDRKQELEERKARIEGELSRFAKRDPKATGGWTSQYPNIPEGAAGDEVEEASEVEEYETRVQVEHTLEEELVRIKQELEQLKKK